MTPRLTDYLAHMLAAAREARAFVDGLDRAGFLQDRRTQQAVVMSLLVVGEAATKVMEAAPAFVLNHPEVPWRSMRSM